MEKGGSSSNLHTRYMYKRRPRGTASQEPNDISIVGANLNPKISTSNDNFFGFLNNVFNTSSNPNRGHNINLNLPTRGRNVNLNDDRYVPIANVIKIMRRVLPPNAKITDEAKQAILECISEFISFITTEANSRCIREYRKTVTSDDVLAAMASLGFDNYAQTLSLFMNKYRAHNMDRRPMPPMASLHRPVARPLPAPLVLSPPPASEMTVGYVPEPAPSDDGYNYYSEHPQLVDYFARNLQQGGGHGEGSSSHEVHDFDPFN